MQDSRRFLNKHQFEKLIVNFQCCFRHKQWWQNVKHFVTRLRKFWQNIKLFFLIAQVETSTKAQKLPSLQLENNLNLTILHFFPTLDSYFDNETCNINADKYFTQIFTKKDVPLKHKISLTINSIQYGCKYCKQHENN